MFSMFNQRRAAFRPLFEWLKENSPGLYSEWSAIPLGSVADRINEVTDLGLTSSEGVRETTPRVIEALKASKAAGRI